MTEIEIFKSINPLIAAIDANNHARQNKKEIISALLTPPDKYDDEYKLVVVFKFDNKE